MDDSKATFIAALAALIVHSALLSIQIGRLQVVSVVAHATSIGCYGLVLLGLVTQKPRRFLPYFVINPLALFAQIIVEGVAHYRRWWSRTAGQIGSFEPKQSEWSRRQRNEWSLDFTLLIVAITLIIATHLLISTIAYRTYRRLNGQQNYLLHNQRHQQANVDCSALYDHHFNDEDDANSGSITRDNRVRCSGGVAFV